MNVRKKMVLGSAAGGVIGDLPWREQLDLPDREWRHPASHLSRPRE